MRLYHLFTNYIGFHHNCRHSRFSRVIKSYTHHGVFYPIGSVIRTDEEYNLNEGKSSSDGNFDEKNNLLVNFHLFIYSLIH